jgi:hypothetical protein
MCRRWGLCKGLCARFTRHRLDPRVMEFFREFFAKLSSSFFQTDRRQGGASAGGLRDGGVGVRDSEELGELGKTRRKERGSHGAAYLGRKTTTAACRCELGSAGGGCKRRRRFGGQLATGNGGTGSSRREDARGDARLSGRSTEAENRATAAHRPAAVQGRGARCRAAAARARRAGRAI